MKHRPSKLPHKSGGVRPQWTRTPIWTHVAFSAWSAHGLLPGRLRKHLTRTQRVASKEAALPLRTRMLRGLGRALNMRPTFLRPRGTQKGTAR